MKISLASQEVTDLLVSTGYKKPVNSLTIDDIIWAILNYHLLYCQGR